MKLRKREKRSRELEHFEARTAECEEIIRILSSALKLIPITQIKQGYVWFPSEEACGAITYAKDRMVEWRNENNL